MPELPPIPAPLTPPGQTSVGERAPMPVPDHTLIRRIGRGSYGEVWLAHNVMGAWRAVKFVHQRDFEDDRPFERELAGIQRFEPISRSHPSQINILHLGRDPDGFYYVLELADDQGRGPEIDEGSYAPRTLRSELTQQADDRRTCRARHTVGRRLGRDATDAHGHRVRSGQVREMEPGWSVHRLPQRRACGACLGCGDGGSGYAHVAAHRLHLLGVHHTGPSAHHGQRPQPHPGLGSETDTPAGGGAYGLHQGALRSTAQCEWVAVGHPGPELAELHRSLLARHPELFSTPAGRD